MKNDWNCIDKFLSAVATGRHNAWSLTGGDFLLLWHLIIVTSGYMTKMAFKPFDPP